MRNNSDHSGVDRWVQEGLGVTRCIHIPGQNLKRAFPELKPKVYVVMQIIVLKIPQEMK